MRPGIVLRPSGPYCCHNCHRQTWPAAPFANRRAGKLGETGEVTGRQSAGSARTFTAQRRQGHKRRSRWQNAVCLPAVCTTEFIAAQRCRRWKTLRAVDRDNVIGGIVKAGEDARFGVAPGVDAGHQIGRMAVGVMVGHCGDRGLPGRVPSVHQIAFQSSAKLSLFSGPRSSANLARHGRDSR